MIYIVDRIRTVVELMRVNKKITPAFLALLGSKVIVENSEEPIPDPLLMPPYFMPGHPLEINNRLVDKTKDPVFRWTKYPLVVLRMDIAEVVRGDMFDWTLNIAIMHSTNKNYNAEQRIANVFKPILHPLYEIFFEEVKNSGMFVWTTNQQKPPHTKIDRPYWGTDSKNGNTASIFEDPLDAVEIVDLKLTGYENCTVKKLL